MDIHVEDTEINTFIDRNLRVLDLELQRIATGDQSYVVIDTIGRAVGLPQEITELLKRELFMVFLGLVPIDEFCQNLILEYGIEIDTAIWINDSVLQSLEPSVYQKLEALSRDDVEKSELDSSYKPVPVSTPERLELRPKDGVVVGGDAVTQNVPVPPAPLTRDALADMFPNTRTMESDIAHLKGEAVSEIPRFRKPFTGEPPSQQTPQGVPVPPPPPPQQ